MSWILGAGLGFFFGGPLGAVVGGAIQHLVGKNTDNRLNKTTKTSRIRNPEAMFITYLVSIMTKIAMADGHISQEERRAIHNFLAKNLRYSGENLKYTDILISQTEKVNPDLKQVAVSFRQFTNTQSCLLLLDICYQIAITDSLITSEEQNALDTLAYSLHINTHDHQRIKFKYYHYNRNSSSANNKRHNTLDDHTILGITTEASNDEVKKAYRQMALQYHPDKVSHLGKELIDFANKKFAEINKAYENIRKQRKI